MAGARLALVVANEDYADDGLRRLAAPGRDADALAEILGDRSVGEFDVQVLRNESAQQIRFAIEDFFADRSPTDLLLVHFSCHGVKNASGELFLAAADTRPTRLGSTAVAADFVNHQMADSRAQRIALFLDCCYGGAFPRGMVCARRQLHRYATPLPISKISVAGAAAWSSQRRVRCSTPSRVTLPRHVDFWNRDENINDLTTLVVCCLLVAALTLIMIASYRPSPEARTGHDLRSTGIVTGIVLALAPVVSVVFVHLVNADWCYQQSDSPCRTNALVFELPVLLGQVIPFGVVIVVMLYAAWTGRRRLTSGTAAASAFLCVLTAAVDLAMFYAYPYDLSADTNRAASYAVAVLVVAALVAGITAAKPNWSQDVDDSLNGSIGLRC